MHSIVTQYHQPSCTATTIFHIAGIEPIHPGLPMEGGPYQGYPFKGIFILSTVLHMFRDFK